MSILRVVLYMKTCIITREFGVDTVSLTKHVGATVSVIGADGNMA